MLDSSLLKLQHPKFVDNRVHYEPSLDYFEDSKELEHIKEGKFDFIWPENDAIMSILYQIVRVHEISLQG